MTGTRSVIRTPDQRLRVFVSSTLQELAEERRVVRRAIESLRLSPVMFELGARPHPPRELYRAYLEQSHVFVGIYWQKYGWVAPGEAVSGLEDEYNLSGDRPKLVYVKRPALEREERLEGLLARVREADNTSYKPFETPEELEGLVRDDLALLLTERFELTGEPGVARQEQAPAAPLPVPVTPFVGREREIAELTGLLTRPDVRLVTVWGPGGTGKTRLAIEVAGRLLDSFPDGVRFVPLASVADAGLVPAALTSVLGIKEAPGRSLAASLEASLAGQRTLLLLDNCEQVLAAGPLLAELLAAAPGLKLLATSRALLRLSGEQSYYLGPLAIPAAGREGDLAGLSQYEAVRLFIARAQAVKPDFHVTDENAPAVAEVCHRLDGLPLAIELAAARVRMLPPQALLARLERGLDVLSGGARDLPARQQTLRNAIDWSHGLLDEPARALFAGLAVFSGGCSLEAVESVCPLEDGGDVLETLATLVDGSLVQQADADGEPRFTMLETIREYALEKLTAGGRAEAGRARHLAYFRHFAHAVDRQLRGTARLEWFARLEREQDNCRAALAWALEHDPPGGAQLAWSLWYFWFTRSRFSEGRRWLETYRAKGEALTREQLARVTWGSGQIAFTLGEVPAAVSLCREAAALAPDDKEVQGGSKVVLGFVAMAGGDIVTAERELAESISLLHEGGDHWAAAIPTGALGRIALERGDTAGALGWFRQALALARDPENPYLVAWSLAHLGYTAVVGGDYAAAGAYLRDGLARAHAVGDRLAIAEVLDSLGGLAQATGEAERAARLLGAAAGLRSGVGAAVLPFPRAHLERVEASLRASLGEAAFAAALQAGRVMSAEEAVRYAGEPDAASVQ